MNNERFKKDKSEDNQDSESSSSPTSSIKSRNMRGTSRGLMGPFKSILPKSLFRPDFDGSNSRVYKLLHKYKLNDELSLLKDSINHHEHTLAVNCTRISDKSAFISVSLALKDRILEKLNDSQQTIIQLNCKRVYFLSMEYLLGRLFQNAVLNLNIEEPMKSVFKNLGVVYENAIEEEQDPDLGTAGLGRLSACFLDSFATMNLPASGYGIRYTYGTFHQVLSEGKQVETVDYWGTDIYPWEIERSDVVFTVGFGGHVMGEDNDNTKPRIWKPSSSVIAKAYDVPVPGYGTINTSYLRLWKSIPDHVMNLESNKKGDYYCQIRTKQESELITSFLYPNKESQKGKELSIKQEYFFVRASLQDIIHNFQIKNSNFDHFDQHVAIQLNDTFPALSIIELFRIFVDELRIEFHKAWDIVCRTFSYTNHSLFKEALENVEVATFQIILPRHLELIYLVNFFWMEKVKNSHSKSNEVLKELSLVEEEEPKSIRMVNFSILACHRVNGVSMIHTKTLKQSLFREFSHMFPDKFISITNGVSVRRWVCVANSTLRDFYIDQLGSTDFIHNLGLVDHLKNRINSPIFQAKWSKIKKRAKLTLARWVKKHLTLEISEEWMFDVLVKKVNETKRQLMILMYVVYRIIQIKNCDKFQRGNFVKRVFILSGKANPLDPIAKRIIEFALALSNFVNNDYALSQHIKVVYIPNFNVSIAELVIPACDISEHISTAGTECSGTSNMKAIMNGAVIIGSRDGANLEIETAVKQDNIFLFGLTVHQAHALKQQVNLSEIEWFVQEICSK